MDRNTIGNEIEAEINASYRYKNLRELIDILLSVIILKTGKKELVGIEERLYVSLGKIFDGETTINDIKLCLSNVIKIEPLLKKMILLIDEDEYDKIVQENLGLAHVITQLGLNPDNKKLDRKPEDYLGDGNYMEHIARSYGMDELVEWFREEGVLVEDNTPREEYYKVMLHTEKAWFYIIVLNVLAFTPAIVVILYYVHRDIPLETTREVFEAIVSYIVMIGMYIATWVAVVGEKTFYLKYQDGKYSYHHWFRKEKTFELDERITYKAREDGIVIYQDNKRLFLTSHGYTNAEFFGRTLLEKNIKCIKGEQYMEKYRDKGQEEI